MRRSLPAFLGLLICAAGLGGCSPTLDQRGNLPDPEKLATIHPGTTTKDEVAKLLGTPSTVGVFNDKSWYYISRRTEQVAFLDPEVLDQEVYVISFDDNGVVKEVAHKDLRDGRDVTPVARETPSTGREMTFLEQLFGNLGRFNKSPSSK